MWRQSSVDAIEDYNKNLPLPLQKTLELQGM